MRQRQEKRRYILKMPRLVHFQGDSEQFTVEFVLPNGLRHQERYFAEDLELYKPQCCPPEQVIAKFYSTDELLAKLGSCIDDGDTIDLTLLKDVHRMLETQAHTIDIFRSELEFDELDEKDLEEIDNQKYRRETAVRFVESMLLGKGYDYSSGEKVNIDDYPKLSVDLTDSLIAELSK